MTPLTRALCFAVAFGLAPLIHLGPTLAQDVKLPPSITFTAYDTGSSGFNIAVAVGKMLKDSYKSDVRVLPAGNDVARLGPLKAGRAQASAMGIGSYFAQEGIFEFAVKDWGPQPLQVLLSSLDCNNISIGIAKDTGAKEIKDLKGKQVGFVVGSPALNQNMLAMLAFGGLNAADVKIAEFERYGPCGRACSTTRSTPPWLRTYPARQKRPKAAAGRFLSGHAASDDGRWLGSRKWSVLQRAIRQRAASRLRRRPPSRPLPIRTRSSLSTLRSRRCRSRPTKAMVDGYADYKDSVPGASGLDAKTQNFQWVLPVHPAAVKAFKAAKVWRMQMRRTIKSCLRARKCSQTHEVRLPEGLAARG